MTATREPEDSRERVAADRARALRRPPHNLEIEQALLGAVLRGAGRPLEAVREVGLAPEHFYAPEHQRLYGYILSAAERDAAPSAAALAHVVDEDPLLKEIGGRDYLYQLDAGLVTIINARQYAETVRDLYLKRELIGVGEDIVNDAFDQTDLDFTAALQVEKAEERLFSLVERGEGAGARLAPVHREADAVLRRIEAACRRDGTVLGLPTGFRDIDAKTAGLQAGDMVILAARPSMGKTTLAVNIAVKAAEAEREAARARAARTADVDGEPEQGAAGEARAVLVWSLEMSEEQLIYRLLAEKTGLPTQAMMKGEIRPDQWEALERARAELDALPLYIEATGARTVAHLRARARRLKRRSGLALIVVDYLQRVDPPREYRGNRVAEMDSISGDMKAVARDLGVPVLALSQLSREVENREDKRPKLADLRQSGSLEQDADGVWFLYRPEYYLEREQPDQRANEGAEKYQERLERHSQRLAEERGVAEVIFAKQRMGPIDTVRLLFDGAASRFSDAHDEWRDA